MCRDDSSEEDTSSSGGKVPPSCDHCMFGCIAGDERIRELKRHQDIHESKES